jgi:ankyrin repeat protein
VVFHEIDSRAVEHNSLELVRLLAAHSADLDILTGSGFSALGLAVLGNRPEAAEVLLEAGADVNQTQKGSQVRLGIYILLLKCFLTEFSS